MTKSLDDAVPTSAISSYSSSGSAVAVTSWLPDTAAASVTAAVVSRAQCLVLVLVLAALATACTVRDCLRLWLARRRRDAAAAYSPRSVYHRRLAALEHLSGIDDVAVAAV